MAEGQLDYKNKVILAPMVRIGTLPARLLALDFGADLVYCEEIIDYKMLQCTRVENVLLGTIDYVMNDGTVIFRTCAKEKGKVVFQIGTSDANRALQVAKLIEKDVAAFDVNMGCPKEFSVKGGMGAALLSQPDKVKEILTTLVNELSIPVTCKIRILPTLEETISFAKLAQSCGIAAIGIHGRLKEERPQHDNHNDIICAVAKELKIPVIANGGSKEIRCYEDVEKFRLDTGASSVMIARAAQWNSSIFRKDGLLPVTDIIKAYLKYAIDYDNNSCNTKYCIQQYFRASMETPEGIRLRSARNETQIYQIWGMEEYHQQVLEKWRKAEGARAVKRKKLDNGKILFEKYVVLSKRDFVQSVSPKEILHNYLKVQNKKAKFHTECRDRLFYSMVEVDNNFYSSPVGDKSKKFAEQAAALVCAEQLGLMEEVNATVDRDTRKVPQAD